MTHDSSDDVDTRDSVVGELKRIFAGLPRAAGNARFESPEVAAIAGHLEVRRRIGAGAKGIVYLARDTRLQRDVAVKLIGVDASGAGVRAEREAQAMAKLSHPHVLAVHEVGTWSGGMYIAMEYVDGSTLRRWQSDPQRRWTEIVAAYAQAARGLHAAHVAGLVHRDFKPDNVLIDREREGPHGIGRVRVGDFGLARGHDEQPGQLAGTPSYIAPEQVLHRADGPLADQFAFGVSLYEALAGERPYAPKDPWEATAADLRPPPRRLPAWLRALLVRTLQLQPQARFPDLGAVADALEGGLSWGSRRRAWIAAAALACVGTAVGLGIGARVGGEPAACGERAVARVWNPERSGQLVDAFARTQSPIHATMSADVTARLDEWAASWEEQRLEACRAHREGEDSEHLHARRTACLDRRLAETEVAIERLLDADREAVAHAIDVIAQRPALDTCADDERLLAAVPPPEDPELATQVESARRRLAEARAELALGRPREAIAIAREVAQSETAAEFVPLHAEAQLVLGEGLLAMHDLSASEAALETALHEAMGSGHDEVVAAAATQLVCDVGMIDGAIDRARRWVPIAEATHRRIAASPQAALVLVRCRAAMHHSAGEYAAAADLLRPAIAALDPEIDDLEHALLHDSLGTVLIAIDQPAAAKPELERADELVQAARGLAHPRALSVRGHLAQALHDLDDDGAAVALSLQTLEGVIAVYGPESAAVLTAYNNVAIALTGAGAAQEVRAYLERGVEIGRKHPDRARTTMMLVTNLASHLLTRREFARALELAREAVALSQSAWGPDHDQTATSRVTLAGALESSGQLSEALAEYDRAIEAFDRSLGPGNRRSGIAHLNIAMTPRFAALRDIDPHLEEAERSATVNGDRVIGGVVATIRAEKLRDRGDQPGARVLQRKAVELLDGADRTQHGIALWFLATDELELGDPAAAFTAFERARELAVAAANDRSVIVNEIGMANAAWAQGEHERARALANVALARSRELDDAGHVAVLVDWLRKHR